MTLEPITWKQAETNRLATARGFAALSIPAGTIRRWAHEGRIVACAKAPGGAHLYSIREVSVVAETMAHRPARTGA